LTSTYIKLQDAYVSESNQIGPWQLVGYVAPGASSASQTSPQTTNFTYSGFVTGSASTIANTNDAWVAQNIPALNDCAAATGKWNINIKANTNGNSVSNDAQTTCAQLTPSFTKIGK
jgi:hypothetical protein